MSAKQKKEIRTMHSLHYLYPDVIYRFNASFHQIWRAEKLGYLEQGTQQEKVVYTIPIFFSKYARAFHWVTVGSSMWHLKGENSEECKNQLEEALERIHKWNTLSEDGVPEGSKLGEYPLEDRKAAWNNFLEDLPQGHFYQEAKDRIKERLETRLKAQSKITTRDFSGTERLQRDLFALYSGFHHSAKKNVEGIVYSFLGACGRNSCGSTELDYLIGEMCSTNENTPPFEWFDFGGNQRGSSCANSCWRKNRYVNLHDSTKTVEEAPKNVEKRLKDPWQELAEYAFLMPLLLDVKGSAGPDGEPFGVRVADKRTTMLVPLYDTWVGGQGIGGIWGVIALFFKDCNDLKKWEENKYRKLKPGLAEISDELTASAKIIAVEEDIVPPYDLVKHFLKVLAFVQDWDEAVVFDRDTNQPRYGYFREEKNDVTWGWEYKDLDTIPGPQKPPGSDNRCPIHEDNGDYYLWLTAGRGNTDLWSPDHIRGLGDEERERFGHLIIRFKFPPACRIPQDDEQCKFLRDAYLRQQLDLMGMLIPKVRARRAALRSAATAVMSRNMSHNIGSHVLSALVSEQALSSENVMDFLKYLQERMDFLAEAATAHSYLEFPARYYYEVIKQFTGQSLLLEKISGTTMTAEVELHKRDNDLSVGMPGGRLGFQAVYVILENFIRNTAKHAAGVEGTGTIKVHVSIQDNNTDFYRVRIWDEMKNGNEIKEGLHLCKFLDKKIEDRKMIDQDGRLDPNDWGIKEMFIAAAYLRKIPLEELEGDEADQSNGKELPLLKVLSVGENGEPVDDDVPGNLCYEFHVRRPRIAMIIGEFEGADKKKLRQQGIDIVSSFSETQKKRIEHQYMVCCNGEQVPNDVDWAYWPVRILERKTKPLTEAIKGNDGLAIWRMLAKDWMEFLKNKHSIGNAVLCTSAASRNYKKNAKELVCDDQTRPQAVWYDRHGEAVDVKKGSQNFIGQDVIDKLLFWEPFNQDYDQVSPFDSPVDAMAAASEFLAAGLSRIVVIDERVQEAVDLHPGWKNGVPKMDQMIRLRRIYVPDKCACDLKTSPNLACIKEFIENIEGKVDFIVVHQGILERVGEGAMETIQNCVKSKEAKLVICSGRGIPTELMDNVRFVPLSSLLRWTVQKPSKYHLYQLLCASRSPKNGK